MRSVAFDALCPHHRSNFRRLAALLEPHGVFVFETYRSPAAQNDAFRRGVSKAKAGQSPHQFGMAVDFVPRTGTNGWHWPAADAPVWRLVGIYAAECGLRHPIKWDKPHVECSCWSKYRAGSVRR